MRVSCLALIALGCCLSAFAEPLVIAHRGASGYLPEHTLEAYAMAYGQGADYIEPDLVRTKDGYFIALHDIHLEGTTNVREVFPERTRDDGRWYAADFTLEELRTLNAVERLPKRFPQGASRFQIPTFEEVIELVQGLNQSTGRAVGIYPELKDPGFHNKEGLGMEADFLAILERYDYNRSDALIFVQCFSEGPLKRLRELGCEAPMIFLASFGTARQMDEVRLREIAAYAQGVGPEKRAIEADPALVTRAHAAGLQVHPYTLRSDALPPKYATPEEEIAAFFGKYKVDGIFTDFPDHAVQWLAEQRAVAGVEAPQD